MRASITKTTTAAGSVAQEKRWGEGKMKFMDFVGREAISVELAAFDKEGVIQELSQCLANAGMIKGQDLDGVVGAVLKREELGSTGIGRGVAVPHTKHPNVDRLVGAVGISREGVDFRSLDGELVQLFFMLVSPPDRPGDHLRALENISRQLRNETFCKFLKDAKSAEDVHQLLKEADDNGFGG